MANYDFVFPYDSRMELWLAEQGYPHPTVEPNNRFPSKREILDAIASSGKLEVECAEEQDFFAVKKNAQPHGAYEIRIGCSNWDELGSSDAGSITMHGGELKVELMVLEILARKCGQLLLYPDTGCPPVIVERGIDIEKINKLWHESIDQPDCWRYFYEKMGY